MVVFLSGYGGIFVGDMVVFLSGVWWYFCRGMVVFLSGYGGIDILTLIPPYSII